MLNNLLNFTLLYYSPYSSFYSPGESSVFWGILIFAFVFGILISLIPVIFYLLTLQNALKQVRPEFRKMPAGQVWLLLIPIFQVVWHFFVVNWIAESLKKELDARGIKGQDERPGYSIGLATSILACLSWIPLVNMLSGLAFLVCWIIYWVKINEFKNLLKNHPVIPENQVDEAPVQDPKPDSSETESNSDYTSSGINSTSEDSVAKEE